MSDTEEETIKVCKDWLAWIEHNLLPRNNNKRVGYDLSARDLERHIDALENIITRERLNVVILFHPLLGQETKQYNREWSDLWERTFSLRGNKGRGTQPQQQQNQSKKNNNNQPNNNYQKAFSGKGNRDNWNNQNDNERLGGFDSNNGGFIVSPSNNRDPNDSRSGFFDSRRTETYDRDDNSTNNQQGQSNFDVKRFFS